MSRATEQRASEARRRRIDTRFTVPELMLIEKVAEWRKLPPSAFVRGAALAAAQKAEGHGRKDDDGNVRAADALTAEQARIIDAARIEVKRVGVNLNQLSRLGHRGELDLVSLAGVIDELAKQYELMVGALGGKGQP